MRVAIRNAKYQEAETTYRKAILLSNTPLQRAGGQNGLGLALKDMGRLAEAHRLVEEALITRESALMQGDPEIAGSYSGMGAVLLSEGRYPESAKYYRMAFEAKAARSNTPKDRLADCLINLAMVEKIQGNYGGAFGHYREALQLLNSMANPPRSSLIAVHNNFGLLLSVMNLDNESRKHLRKALIMVANAGGLPQQTRALVLQSLAGVELRMGHSDKAKELAEEAARILKPVTRGGTSGYAGILILQALIDVAQNKVAAAEEKLIEVQATLARIGITQVEQSDMHYLLARMRLKQKREKEALDHLEKGIRITQQSMGPNAPSLVGMLSLYSEILRRSQRIGEAAKAEQQLTTISTKIALAKGFVPAAQ